MKIGINTFGIGKLLSQDFDGTLDKLKEIGVTSIEGTPIKDVVESDARCAVLEKYIPGVVDRIKENMTIAYWMPLGMAFKLVENNLSPEDIHRMMVELNEAK